MERWKIGGVKKWRSIEKEGERWEKEGKREEVSITMTTHSKLKHPYYHYPLTAFVKTRRDETR